MTDLEQILPFSGLNFAHVLSIGGDRGAGQAVANVPETVFDRLRPSLSAVAEILADGGAKLGSRFVAFEGGTKVRCDAYGFSYEDEFPRNGDGQIVFSAQAVENLRVELAQAMAAFLQACHGARGPVLFLWLGAQLDGLGESRDAADVPGGSAIDAFVAAVGRMSSLLDFRLAFLFPGLAPAGGAACDRRVVFVRRPEGQLAWRRPVERLAVQPPDGRGSLGVAEEPNAEAGLIARDPDDHLGLDDLPARMTRGHATPDVAWQIGKDLWKGGRAAQAAEAFALAFAHGCRQLPFLRDHLGLLTGETRYREVLGVIRSLRQEGFGDHPLAGRHMSMLAGHAKLAIAHPREAELARAEAREASRAWLDATALLSAIATAIEARRPFSLIRLGDGEARYLLAESPQDATGLADDEAQAMGDLVWENWFGERLAAASPGRREGLRVAFAEAVSSADVIGSSGASRLRSDTGHYGYLAWQENWLRDLVADRSNLRFTDAQIHHEMNAQAPFLRRLLDGQAVLGVVSPHPGLADALGQHLRIAKTIEHIVPAEGRLHTAAQAREMLGRHFPDGFDRLMKDILVPHPGCVFLVAAGLLGKIYCARIKSLGGVALDIGALADAWMGYDTRDGQFAETPRLPITPPKASAIPKRTVACLSMHKTGSVSLAAALRSAGIDGVLHSHQAGPRTRALIRELSPRPMTPDDGLSWAGRHDQGDLALVTCVRDPIAQAISMYFQHASSLANRWGITTSLAPEDFVRWWERSLPADFAAWWFEDNLRTPFGIDLLSRPFDHESRSLRLEVGRLRLVCLRLEDPAEPKEAALGWLVGRDAIQLGGLNATAAKKIGPRYRSFVEDFKAPSHWIETFYDCAAIRHFYTVEEREGFKRRWSGDRLVRRQAGTPSKRAASDMSGHPSAGTPIPAAGELGSVSDNTTYGCISLGKTGSMALADALRSAGHPDVVHLHYLGPRAISIKQGHPEPMLELAARVARRIDDANHSFRLVTAVRDPIARILSQAFYTAERHVVANGGNVSRSRESLIAWWDAKPVARFDLWSEWFDDTFKTTFGFDFRDHELDRQTRSVRFESGRLKLLILRQEDERERRQSELGWLLGRDDVILRQVNDAVNQNYQASYRPFLETFVAPSHWIETLYESDVIRHFYSDEERSAFQLRWSGTRTVSGPSVGVLHDDTWRERQVGNQSDHPAVVDLAVDSSPSSAERSATTRVSAAPAYDRVPEAIPDVPVDLLRAREDLELLRGRFRDGRAIDFNDYAYRPRERDWSRTAGAERLRISFAAGEAAYTTLLERFCGFDDRFRAISVLPEPGQPFWENWWLPGLDAVALYGLVATLKPRVYLEIGSGHSTRFVRRAIRDHGLATRIVSVDPNPTSDIDDICDEVVRATCEEASNHLFASLRGGDMLFFDGGHRSFQNSDVTVFFTEILPSLPRGVVYGLHDVFLPFDYPADWTGRFYNEQYLLMAYLLGGAGGDTVLFPAHHVWREPAFARFRNRLFLGTRHIDWLTSSFWMRRGDAPAGDE